MYRLTLTLQSVVSLALRRWAGGFLAGAALAVSAPVQAEELRLVTGELPTAGDGSSCTRCTAAGSTCA